MEARFPKVDDRRRRALFVWPDGFTATLPQYEYFARLPPRPGALRGRRVPPPSLWLLGIGRSQGPVLERHAVPTVAARPHHMVRAGRAGPSWRDGGGWAAHRPTAWYDLLMARSTACPGQDVDRSSNQPTAGPEHW